MDYYSILGVPKNATEKDLKKAYKKMSMQHHPDRGGNEETFKQINEAYSTLKDPQKRAEYDNPQPEYRFNTSNMGSGHPFEDLFAQGFGQWGRQSRTRGNRDVQISYTIDLVDCFVGKNITIKYNIPSGKQEMLDIHLPPGCKNGDVIKFDGHGDNSLPGPRGNLLLRIKIRKNRDWIVDGLDIATTKKISILDLMTGTEIEIHSPEGKRINLKIPKGSQSGTTFSVTGYGIPNVKRGNRGNLYIKIIGVVPTIQDEKIIKKVRDLNDEISKIS